MISEINDWAWEELQASLLPVDDALPKKVALYAYQFFKFILLTPVCAVTSSLNLIASRFSKKIDDPLVEFAKRPTWHPLGPSDAAPIKVGFATAGFQDNGPKGHPNTNWGEFHKHHDLGLVPDFWNHPERYIETLQSMNVRDIRFSIDRDKLQTEPNGPINPFALERYREIIRLFKASGIEPMITLMHFCDPTYFSWERADDIPPLVNYAAQVCTMLAEEKVEKIVTINEPTVVAFQGWVMGKFPPEIKLDFKTAGKVLENMMKAHTEIYNTVKAAHPELQIGLSHDPIRFRNFHKWNPLWSPIERLLCHYLTEINHSALMRYLETGRFELKVPFRANHSFTTAKPPLDFIGIQYYSDPLLKLSFTGGESVSRIEGEPTATYQFRMYPQGLASALYEVSKLGVPIEITEIGMDTGIPENLRIQYFARVFQSIQKALDQGIPVRSCYFWTPIQNIEWYKGWEVDFGFCGFNNETGEIKRRPVCDWLQGQVGRYYEARDPAPEPQAAVVGSDVVPDQKAQAPVPAAAPTTAPAPVPAAPRSEDKPAQPAPAPTPAPVVAVASSEDKPAQPAPAPTPAPVVAVASSEDKPAQPAPATASSDEEPEAPAPVREKEPSCQPVQALPQGQIELGDEPLPEQTAAAG